MEEKKSGEAKIESWDYRTLFILLGLVAVFGLTLGASENYKKEQGLIELQGNPNDGLEDEEVMELAQAPPPPPPPPPPPAPVDEIEIVEDEEEIEETVVVVEEVDVDEVVEIVDIPMDEGEPEVDEIFEIVEEEAEFPGGMEALMNFLRKNTKYPPMAQEAGIQGRVYVQFVVRKDGKIDDVQVIRKVNPALDKEAVRVVKSMPNWQPGKQRGKAVSSRFRLPVVFKLR